ncbi:MAG: hypothetical protein IJ647_00830 [Prevotella sp.]|nr:hypothetical protein [Prevotella sp.]
MYLNKLFQQEFIWVLLLLSGVILLVAIEVGAKIANFIQTPHFSWRIFGTYYFYCYLCRKNMAYDISKPIPQGGDGAYDEEDRRLHEITNELYRRCQLHEAQSGASQANGNCFEIELRIAEQYAKEKGIWIPMHEVFDLGTPGPSGNENDTYVSSDIVFKVNNLLNSASILLLLKKIEYHNILFPNTYYGIYGFTGFDGRSVMPVLSQRLVKNAQPATTIEVDTYMAALGFTKVNNEGRYTNSGYEVWDVVPRNVLKDDDGDIYVIDAEIKRI